MININCVMKPERKKVVLVGGGFAGLHVAKALNKSNYDVMLIDKQNHHQFQPLYYQVASARHEPSNISFPFRKLFQKSKNVEIRLTEVTAVKAETNQVETPIGTFDYDYLIIATGCKTNFFGNAEIETVSYTHLDVYKRQGLCISQPLTKKTLSLCGEIPFPNLGWAPIWPGHSLKF